MSAIGGVYNLHHMEHVLIFLLNVISIVVCARQGVNASDSLTTDFTPVQTLPKLPSPNTICGPQANGLPPHYSTSLSYLDIHKVWLTHVFSV